MKNSELSNEIDEAIKAHGLWRDRLANGVVDGKLETPACDIGRDDLCRFGKWLGVMRTDSKIGPSPHYSRAWAGHAAFHKLAGEIATEIERGNVKKARQRLENPVYDITTRVLVKDLRKWQDSLSV